MSDTKMVQKVIHSTNAQTLTHAAQGIARISVRPCIDSLPRQLFFSHVCNTIMVFCAVRNNAHRNQNQVTEAFCGSQGQMTGEATEVQPCTPGCGS